MSESTRAGRPSATTRGELERVALRLFTERGFDATTVDDVAEAAGIGRRTFFRYFASKNDVVWGEFAEGLSRLRAHLADADPAGARPLLDVLRDAVLAFNALDPQEEPRHRERMALHPRRPRAAGPQHPALRRLAGGGRGVRCVAYRGRDRRRCCPRSWPTPASVPRSPPTSTGCSTRGADLPALLDEALRVLDGGWAGPVTPVVLTLRRARVRVWLRPRVYGG